MRRTVTAVVAVAVLAAGVWYAFGSGIKGSGTYGSGVGTRVTALADITKNPKAFVGKTVTIEGTLTQECPSSGCWWYTRDASGGELRASSEGAGFALPLHQKGKTLRTTGRVIQTETGTLELAATGARF